MSLAVLLGAAQLPALAASTAASSASEGGSASVGSVSTSIRKSSDSSSKATGIAQGDYRIIEVTVVAEQPGLQRLALQAVADDSEQGALFLYVPQPVVVQARLAAGQVVNASQRPYGIQFAKAESREAFFLVLEDDWYRELPSRPVAL
ncbi:hypothetical protein [Aquabacterium sp.]|uniref:hypothetical protein n=1 Tax=Aquabacterium sp. TaxID=1872578 RepID=UPI002CBB00EE|nr:hypothetical protein [Aquabacterium sp.]HSW05020.1 hypothetical protein [Aquabacterium sp.]